MTELGFRVTDVSLQAGELARIGVVVPRDEPRSVFVQLVLLERKLKRVDFQIGAPDPRVVAEVPVAAGASSVELPVPHDLPPAYDGETIAWSYELRLLNDWRRPDDRCRLTVDVAPPWWGSRPSVPTRALGEPASSRPLEISKLVREPGSEKGSTFGLALVMLGGAGGFGWFGFTRGDDTTGQVIFLVLALIALGVGLLALYTVFLDPGRHMDTVRVSVRQPVVGAGESIEVDVDPGEMTDLVARLRCVEMAVWQRKRTNSAGVAYDTADCDVVDIAAPVRNGRATLRTPETQLRTYPGSEIGLYWLVEVGAPKSKTGRAGILVDVVP